MIEDREAGNLGRELPYLEERRHQITSSPPRGAPSVRQSDLQVMGGVIGILGDLSQGAAAPAPHPFQDTANDSVAHDEHDENEQSADDDLPPFGKLVAQKELGALDQERADHRSKQRPAAADRGPDHAFDRIDRPSVKKRDDANPRRIHRSCRSCHESRDAKYENAIIGDVVAHEFGAQVVVPYRFQHGADARVGQQVGR